MPKPKFDYDSDEFYEEIYALALQGFNDAEIADGLEAQFGQTLTPTAFSLMKNGKYEAWTEEENKRRSERLFKVLARGRRKITAIVRGRYLKCALGGIKTKNVSVVKRPVLNEETGEYEDVVVQKNESEFESPPNIQALSTWLFHHDPEWRKVQRGLDAEVADIPTDIDKGVDIEAWIKKETEMDAGTMASSDIMDPDTENV